MLHEVAQQAEFGRTHRDDLAVADDLVRDRIELDIGIGEQFAGKRGAQAAENGREPDAEAEYLLIHGLLHLLGHDHAEPEEKAVMFGLNDKIIAAWELARR